MVGSARFHSQIPPGFTQHLLPSVLLSSSTEQQTRVLGDSRALQPGAVGWFCATFRIRCWLQGELLHLLILRTEMNGLGKGSVEKGFAIPPGKRSRLESLSPAVVITVIKQSTRSWHRHRSRSLELCFWHGARALGSAGQSLWRIRRSVLQRALPSKRLGQRSWLREAEGKLMSARTWACTGACGLSPAFPAGLGMDSTRHGCGQGPRGRTCSKGTRDGFSCLGVALPEPHLHPPGQAAGLFPE